MVPDRIYRPPLPHMLFTRGLFWLFMAIFALILWKTISNLQTALCPAILVFWFIPLLMWVNLFRPIGIQEEGLVIYGLLGSRKNIRWVDIIQVKPVRFPLIPRERNRKTMIVKVRHIGWLYRFYGLVYDGGGEGFLIPANLQSYAEFFRELDRHLPAVPPPSAE